MGVATQRIWAPEEIAARLLTSQQWLERGVVAIYSMQTEDEKANGITTHLNGVGFSAYHSPFMSSLARRILKGWHLSIAQSAAARKIMPRYAKQLAAIANSNVRLDTAVNG